MNMVMTTIGQCLMGGPRRIEQILDEFTIRTHKNLPMAVLQVTLLQMLNGGVVDFNPETKLFSRKTS